LNHSDPFEPRYVKRTCPECHYDEMQIDSHNASVLFCPRCWNTSAHLVQIPRFELDLYPLEPVHQRLRRDWNKRLYELYPPRKNP
jgi:hypothetical protein